MPIMVLPLENPQTQLEYIQPYFMVLMCSRNCFASPYIKECVLKARFLQACAVLPVISDEDFVLHASAPVVATDCEDGEAYQSVLAVESVTLYPFFGYITILYSLKLPLSFMVYMYLYSPKHPKRLTFSSPKDAGQLRCACGRLLGSGLLSQYMDSKLFWGFLIL